LWLLALCALTWSAPQTANEKPEYEAWIRPYRTEPVMAGIIGSDGELVPVRLVITAIRGDKAGPPRNGFGIPGEDYRFKTGCPVSAGGRGAGWALNGIGLQPGERDIPRDDLKEIEALTAKLPDDTGRVPPPDHRLIVQVLDGQRILARIYDRTDLPTSLQEMVRLLQCRFD